MGTPSPIETKLTLGKFDLIEKLGDRYLGPVYRGFDQELGRAVVIRILCDGIKWSPKVEDLFDQECRSAANLQHPNIAEIFEIGKEGTSPYIVMESLGSRNVEKLIAQKSAMPVEAKLWILIQLAEGLSYAHKKGVLHLDLAPDKIHVTPDGTAKIRDFAITHVLIKHLPRPVVRWGVPIYLSPEQIQNKPCDQRSDIFSLGTIFYEFFTYLHPFHDPNGNKALDNVVNDTLFPTFEQFSELPPGIWTILKTCLARNPNERYRSMEDLANAARELQTSLSEDNRLMLAELYAALNPLRKIVAQPCASDGAHKLLADIQRIAKGECEAHYTLLDRLTTDLIEQYPAIQAAGNAQENGAVQYFSDQGKIPMPLSPAAPSADMPIEDGKTAESAEAMPEEKLDSAPPILTDPDPAMEIAETLDEPPAITDETTAAPEFTAAEITAPVAPSEEPEPEPIPATIPAAEAEVPPPIPEVCQEEVPVPAASPAASPIVSGSVPNTQSSPVTRYRKIRRPSYKTMALLLALLLIAAAGYMAWKAGVPAAIHRTWESFMTKSQASLKSFAGRAAAATHLLTGTSEASSQKSASGSALPTSKPAGQETLITLDGPLDPTAQKLLSRVSSMIDAGMIPAARIELDKLQDIYPNSPELAKLRKRLEPRPLKQMQVQMRKEEDPRIAQRRQKEEEWNRQASNLFANGRYEDAESVLNTWLAESPGNPQAQEISAKVEEVQKNLRAYTAQMSENRYQEALNTLHNVEKINPTDPNVAGLRRQSESRKANARATLSIHRIGAKGTLYLDGRPIGRDGELENEAIPIGQHTITVENDGSSVSSRSMEFFEGQRMAMVYDLAKKNLRAMAESDRDLMAQRKFMEQTHSFELEHYHGVLRGVCRGTLMLDYSDIAFKPSSGSHGFRIPFKLIKIGKVDGKSVELLYITDNQRFQTFKFLDTQSLERFRQVWGELKSIAAR